MLGDLALTRKACPPKALSPIAGRFRGHSSEVPKTKEFPEPTTAFQANIQRLIRESGRSVNEWSDHYKLVQTTVNRIVNGQDPRLSMILLFAERLEVEPWQLISEDMGTGGDKFDSLSGQESQLVMLYRRIPLEKQHEALATLNTLGNRPGETPNKLNPFANVPLPGRVRHVDESKHHKAPVKKVHK